MAGQGDVGQAVEHWTTRFQRQRNYLGKRLQAERARDSLGPVKHTGDPGPGRFSSSEFNNIVSHHENIEKCKRWVNFSWIRKLS